MNTFNTNTDEFIWLFYKVIPSLYKDTDNSLNQTFNQDKLTIIGTDVNFQTIESKSLDNQKAYAYKRLQSLYNFIKTIDFEQYYPVIVNLLQNYNEIFDENNTLDMVKEWKKLCLINKFKEDIKRLDSTIDFSETK